LEEEDLKHLINRVEKYVSESMKSKKADLADPEKILKSALADIFNLYQSSEFLSNSFSRFI